MPDAVDIGLALSGGGYRAMLFNLGSVWRLNEMGWLPKLDMITSVSGGSIFNGVLATRWSRLRWEDRAVGRVAANFAAEVGDPVRKLAGRTLDVFAGIEGILSIFSTISDKVTERYDEHLFHGAQLQDVPPFEKGKTPRFLFYATSLQTGSSVRIERKRLADYKVGEIPNPKLPVARVVAASSAFPPVLSPVELEVDPKDWQHLPGAFLFGDEAYRKRLLLSDGGVYDNMGLEAIWDRCHTVLVSDAGAPLDMQPDPATDWTRQAMRVLDIVTEQTRALRRRRLMQDFKQPDDGTVDDRSAEPVRKGTYWGITTRIDRYGVEALTHDTPTTAALQTIRTRLNEFSVQEQGRLINWGYALTDAAMRAWVEKGAAGATTWPVPEHPL
jgi:NTE family protein